MSGLPTLGAVITRLRTEGLQAFRCKCTCVKRKRTHVDYKTLHAEALRGLHITPRQANKLAKVFRTCIGPPRVAAPLPAPGGPRHTRSS